MSDAADRAARSRTGPFVLEVPADRSFFLCQCGKTKKAPNCDASHRTCAGKVGPLPYRLKAKKRVLFCGCLGARTMPFCDNTHKVRHGTQPLEAVTPAADGSAPDEAVAPSERTAAG